MVMSDIRQLADIFEVMSVPSRVATLVILNSAPASTASIADIVGSPARTTSANLAILRVRGIITSRRIGNVVLYELTELGKLLADTTITLHEFIRGAGE